MVYGMGFFWMVSEFFTYVQLRPFLERLCSILGLLTVVGVVIVSLMLTLNKFQFLVCDICFIFFQTLISRIV